MYTCRQTVQKGIFYDNETLQTVDKGIFCNNEMLLDIKVKVLSRSYRKLCSLCKKHICEHRSMHNDKKED